MDYFWEKFMRITYNSAYDILGTVQPDNENFDPDLDNLDPESFDFRDCSIFRILIGC